MQPEISQQLDRIGQVLRTVVAPAVEDPYAKDVLNGLLYALNTLAAGAGDMPRFLAWDAQAAASVLESVGLETPQPPEDPLDPVALENHHRDVRTSLETAMPTIAADPDAARRMARYGRDRLSHNPYCSPLPTPRGR